MHSQQQQQQQQQQQIQQQIEMQEREKNFLQNNSNGQSALQAQLGSHD
jgi:hypothetical protein